MAESWVRLWSGMTTDPKWQTVARKSGQPRCLVIALFTHLMLEANDAENRGSLADVDIEDVASALDCDEEAVVAILNAMEGRVIEEGRLSGWDRRQPVREDSGSAQTGALSSTERSRLHREKKRNATHGNARNDDATHGNAPEAEAEADTEADMPPSPPAAREARDGEFPMDLSWEPSDHFPTLARQAGIPADHVTPEALAEFRSYWMGQGKANTQHGWDHKLLTNLKAQKLRGGQAPTGRATARASPGQPRTLSDQRAAAAKAIFNPGPVGANDGHERRTIDVTPALADGLGAKALR